MKHPRKAATGVLERRRDKQREQQARFERLRAAGDPALANQYVLVNAARLNPDNPYAWGVPAFVTRGYYLPQPFVCKTCGVSQVWTETQQKWWYEVARGNIWTLASLCRPCRRRERERRSAAREAAQAGMAVKLPRQD